MPIRKSTPSRGLIFLEVRSLPSPDVAAVRYLPEWMPGAGFKKTAREFKATLTELVEKPLRFAKKQMANKQHSPSYVSELYEKDDDEFTIKWTAATLYAAGADTVRFPFLLNSLPQSSNDEYLSLWG